MIINAYVISKCMIDLLHHNNDLLQLYQKAETADTGTDDAEKALMAHAKLLTGKCMRTQSKPLPN